MIDSVANMTNIIKNQLQGQGLGKWNQGISEPITVQTRIRKQGLGYQERKVKFGQDMLTRKWSISKKVTRAHINMINFDWSKVIEPDAAEDKNVAKWVQ